MLDTFTWGGFLIESVIDLKREYLYRITSGSSLNRGHARSETDRCACYVVGTAVEA
jgi:hypothetical protein